jgi:hypothetical protein
VVLEEEQVKVYSYVMDANKWYNPIEQLKPGIHNLMNHLSSGLELILQQEINNTNIQFVYDNSLLPIKTPKGELNTHRILLQDTHMSFLWCFSYITVALNSMYYQQAKMNTDIVVFNDLPDFEKVDLTMNWARSLKQDISPWPENAGRPDIPDVWTEGATNLYQACVAYLLFHEIGHVVMHQHLLDLATRRMNRFYVLTPEDKKQIYDAELEADHFALNCLMGNSKREDVRMVKYLGAVLAQLSNFYMLDTPDTRGGTHPDHDVRLKAIIQRADLTTEANQIQLNAHLCVGLQLFFKLTGKEFIQMDGAGNAFKDFEALQTYLFGLIDQMKNAATQ